MKRIFILAVTMATFGIASISHAAPLDVDSQEALQLQAMGYEVNDTENGSMSIASLGTEKIVIDKNSERTAMYRLFTSEMPFGFEKKLEVYEIINKINIDDSYQISISDSYVTVALYQFGEHNPQTFAKLIRQLTRAQILFEANPRLIELLDK